MLPLFKFSYIYGILMPLWLLSTLCSAAESLAANNQTSLFIVQFNDRPNGLILAENADIQNAPSSSSLTPYPANSGTRSTILIPQYWETLVPHIVPNAYPAVQRAVDPEPYYPPMVLIGGELSSQLANIAENNKKPIRTYRNFCRADIEDHTDFHGVDLTTIDFKNLNQYELSTLIVLSQAMDDSKLSASQLDRIERLSEVAQINFNIDNGFGEWLSDRVVLAKVLSIIYDVHTFNPSVLPITAENIHVTVKLDRKSIVTLFNDSVGIDFTVFKMPAELKKLFSLEASELATFQSIEDKYFEGKSLYNLDYTNLEQYQHETLINILHAIDFEKISPEKLNRAAAIIFEGPDFNPSYPIEHLIGALKTKENLLKLLNIFFESFIRGDKSRFLENLNQRLTNKRKDPYGKFLNAEDIAHAIAEVLSPDGTPILKNFWTSRHKHVKPKNSVGFKIEIEVYHPNDTFPAKAKPDGTQTNPTPVYKIVVPDKIIRQALGIARLPYISRGASFLKTKAVTAKEDLKMWHHTRTQNRPYNKLCASLFGL